MNPTPERALPSTLIEGLPDGPAVRQGAHSIAYWLGHLTMTLLAQRKMAAHKLIVAIDQLGTRRRNEPAVLVAQARYVEWRFDDGSSVDGLFDELPDGELCMRRMVFHKPDGSTIVEVEAGQPGERRT